MKILEIKDNKGYFRVSAKSTLKAIDAIDKDDLMRLLNTFLRSQVEMDPPDENKLQNQAQLIIYRSIFEKFRSLQDNKSKFKDEGDRKYITAIQKYSEGTTSDDSLL